MGVTLYSRAMSIMGLYDKSTNSNGGLVRRGVKYGIDRKLEAEADRLLGINPSRLITSMTEDAVYSEHQMNYIQKNEIPAGLDPVDAPEFGDHNHGLDDSCPTRRTLGTPIC